MAYAAGAVVVPGGGGPNDGRRFAGGADMGCGGAGDLCFEPTGAEVVSDNWVYKGDARGAYASVEQMTYVGDRRGTYDREQVLHYTGWRCRTCCYILMFIMFLVSIGIILYIFLPSQTVVFVATSEQEEKLTTPLPYDCQAGFWNWQKEWSDSKKSWCCNTANRGCAPPTTSLPYDCQAALNNWKAAWSQGKKTWCCVHRNLGCPPAAPDYHCHLGDIDRWRLSKRAYCCDHYNIGCGPTTTSEPYDCTAGASNWQAGWSSGKKSWCCSKYNIGCPTTEPYNCNHNLMNLDLAWSLRKQAYCCAHHQRGCTTTTSLPYDCYAGFSNWEAGWSISKKHWCCAHTSKGCVTTTLYPYDCDAALDNWRAAWSNLKKIWCCDHFQRGCETTTTKSSLPYDCDAGFSNWQAGWSISKKMWCCQRMGRGCTTTTTAEPYDCQAGYSNWELGWSASQKHWCCAYKNKACSAFDCAEGLQNWQASWGEAKRAWCCEKHGKGCTTLTTSLPFDCAAGLVNWEAGWSEAKKVWCCQAGRANCVEAKKGACVLWGDPHVKTFDNSRSVFYSEGDFWIVKSSTVQIQGRFQATDWTKKNDHTDYSSMTSLVIGGPFMQGHKIKVDSMLGNIECDGREILSNFGQDHCGLASLNFDSQGALVDSAMAFLPHKVVHIELPEDVSVQANRWPNFMNAKVMMTKRSSQDGVCGNFNDDPSDDLGKELHERFGHGVSPGEEMFTYPIPWHRPEKMPSSKRCSPERLTRATAICRQAATEHSWSEAECLGDVCDAHTAGQVSVQAQEMQKALR